MRLLIFFAAISLPFLISAKESIWTCTDENNFITSFKLDESKNLVTHLGSIVSGGEDSINAGKTYNINEKLNVLDWRNNHLIVSGTNDRNTLYIRIFDFEFSTKTVLDPNSGSEKPWAMKSKCFLTDL